MTEAKKDSGSIKGNIYRWYEEYKNYKVVFRKYFPESFYVMKIDHVIVFFLNSIWRYFK